MQSCPTSQQSIEVPPSASAHRQALFNSRHRKSLLALEDPIQSFAFFFSLACFSPLKEGEAEELGNIMDSERTGSLVQHLLMSYQGFFTRDWKMRSLEVCGSSNALLMCYRVILRCSDQLCSELTQNHFLRKGCVHLFQ